MFRSHKLQESRRMVPTVLLLKSLSSQILIRLFREIGRPTKTSTSIRGSAD